MKAVEARALARQLQGDEERHAFLQARNAASAAAPTGRASPPRARANPPRKDPKAKPSIPSFLQKKRPASDEVQRPEGDAGGGSKQAKLAESAPAAAAEARAAPAAPLPSLVAYDSSGSESD